MLSNRNIAAFLDDHAVRRVRHTAIIEGATGITYGQLAPQVRRTARHLRDAGVTAGEIVGVCLRDSAHHLVVLFALARLGAVILPLDWRWTPPEKARVTRFFQVRRAIVEPDDSISGSVCLPVDAEWDAAVASADDDIGCAAGGDRPLVLSLSSGTTGRPKGPMLSHAQLISRLVIQWVTLGVSQHDRYLSATPLYFGGGRSFSMGGLFSGATVILFPPPHEPAALVAAVAEHRATTLMLVPTLLRRLLQLEGPTPLLGGLQRLLSTGAVLHPEERRAVMARLCPDFINYYGSTEGGGITVLLPEHQGAAEASVGEPVFLTEVQVVDDAGSTLQPDAVGHIRYRGPGVADGFYNDPGASATAFRDGWFYPGDLGRFDADGRLHLAGRAKDVIIRAGVNIYASEIEQVLLAHPLVRDAAAVGWASPLNGEDVAAFVAADPRLEEEPLLAHCRENLAPYKIPKRIFFVTELPKSPLGKVLKAELARRLPVL
jgi:acyl-CoA synthetase (AMP-forming)/AMP-acid ligase II